MAEIEVTGLSELLGKIEQLGKKAAAAENKALRAGAAVLQEEISRRAPRSDGGGEHLADNIKISGIKSRDGMKYVEVGIQKGDNSEFFYGKFLEWGTSRMPARPFMGPVAAEKQAEVIKAMEAALRSELNL